MTMIAIRARYVFPVASAPLRDGIVVIGQDRILAVGSQNSPAVRDFSAAARDLGNVAVLPGLVNPHTHLEFSDLRQPLGAPGMAFPEWIRLVVGNRQNRPLMSEAIARGIAESSSHGVIALGEIASTAWRLETSQPLEITEFIEAMALKPDRIETKWEEVKDAISADNTWSGLFRPGLSPHAPYSVHPELLRRLVRFSAEQKIPVAHHLAESREELELLRNGSGLFVPLLKDFGAWDADAIPPRWRPLDYLRMLAGAHRAFVIHGNYLDAEEIEFLAAHADRMTVVYCPRTHGFFKHEPYPLAKMLAAGVNVAIGTDSRASAPDLNPLAEMRFASQRHQEISPDVLLRMITSAGAKALGRDEEIGTVAPGKFADLAIVQLPNLEADDPHELLLDSASRTLATVFRGKVVYQESKIDLTAGSS